MNDEPVTPRSGQRVIALAGLFLLALAIRALPIGAVLGSDRVYFTGMDAYYHMRRILYCAASFPTLLDFDPYINFPEGGMPIWPPYFDAAVAFVLLPFYAAGGGVALERAAVWVPPVLGALCVLAVVRLARRSFDSSSALVAATLLALISGHFWYSQIGFVDHHAAVALVSTLLLATAMSLLTQLARDPGVHVPAIRTSGALGALCAGILLLWPGALLHVGIIEVALLGFLLTRATRGAAAGTATTLALSHAVAFVIVSPASLGNQWPQWGAMSPVVLSAFQPWLFASLAIHASICALLWRGSFGTSTTQRAAMAGALGIGLIGASALLLPGWTDGLADAWRWLSKAEAFQASVNESKPLFQVGAGFGVRIAEARLSRFIYLFPLALAAIAWHARRREDRAAQFLFVAWCVILAALTLLQKRFFNSFSVSLAVVMGWTAVTSWRAAGSMARSELRWALRCALVSVGIFLMLPVANAYRGPVTDTASWMRGEDVVPRSTRTDLRRLVQTADWLRENTPQTAGFFDVSQRPAYGVMSLHGSGHVLEYVARRPTVSDNFGDDLGRQGHMATVRYFSARREEDAIEILDRLGVRYVVAESAPLGVRGSRARPMIQRLFQDDGRGLSEHRLVFATTRPARSRLGAYKVFERVAGARLRGRAEALAQVTARLSYTTQNLVRRSYEVTARADEDGHWELHLAHATRGGPRFLRSDPAYEIESGGRSVAQVVDEEAVLKGVIVEGPDLRF